MATAEACELAEELRKSKSSRADFINQLLSCHTIGKLNNLSTVLFGGVHLSVRRNPCMFRVARNFLHCKRRELRREENIRSAFGDFRKYTSRFGKNEKYDGCKLRLSSLELKEEDQHISTEPKTRREMAYDTHRRSVESPVKEGKASLNFRDLSQKTEIQETRLFEKKAHTVQRPDSIRYECNVPVIPRQGGKILDFRGIPNVTGLETKQNKLSMFEKECTMIAESLYVGGEAVARDLTVLESCGITHIINCAADLIPSCFPERFQYLSLHLRDAVDEDISVVIPEVISFIENALQHSDNKRWDDGKAVTKSCNGNVGTLRFRKRDENGESSRIGQNLAGKKPRVLLHCHQGVSRSCSLAIAYLMHKTGNSYDLTYRSVKARRKICRPNLKFTCDLLDFGARCAGTAPTCNRQGLFRVRYHSRDKSPLLVCEKLLKVTSKVLDNRGVFLLQPSQSYRDDGILIWVGKNCSQTNRSRFISCAKKFAKYLFSVEHVTTARNVSIYEAGKGKRDELLASLGAEQREEIGTLAEYDEDYSSRTKAENNKKSVEQSLEKKVMEIDINEEIEVSGPDLIGDEDDIDIEDSCDVRASLFEYPSYSNLSSFTTDDLFSDKCYILFSRRKTRAQEEHWLHVWLGEGFNLPPEFGNDQNAFAEHVATEMRKRVHDIATDALIMVEIEDEESEQFMEGFKEG
eukprot:CAMPEP_0184496546 /NCGR_PEP_ID=MMETSP0113_2-20130426/34208_1 /TAXON_ID=91329 /ORGANISM="Norrisiella sphaerica, Strain BC52" /LENGTH=690 /DNA_ID=CAMNT_0026883215 /DNA_START=429 /DNA_END=2501 /DNA_ORIENTATION=+